MCCFGVGTPGLLGLKGSHKENRVRNSFGRHSKSLHSFHGCCWETLCIFAYCGLVGNAHSTAKDCFFASLPTSTKLWVHVFNSSNFNLGPLGSALPCCEKIMGNHQPIVRRSGGCFYPLGCFWSFQWLRALVAAFLLESDFIAPKIRVRTSQYTCVEATVIG